TYWWMNLIDFDLTPTYFFSNNQFDFGSLEQFTTVYRGVCDTVVMYPYNNTLIPVLEYTTQAVVPLQYNRGKLSVSVGGTYAEDTFMLYKDGRFNKMHIGDSSFTITAP